MANVACWYQTQLPTKIIDILIDDIENLKPEGFLIKSKVIGADNQSEGNFKENIRKLWERRRQISIWRTK